MVEATFLIHSICSIKMTGTILSLQDCSPFEALRSGIERNPVAVHEMARKCGESGDFELFRRIMRA